MSNKTHWLQSPNKNYLGYWDLPNGEDLILTIESANWEEVIDPVRSRKNNVVSESKRVIRFKENVKPLICNQTNAQSIITSTNISFMEDSVGCRIKLHVGIYKCKITKQDISCIRIRTTEQLNVSQIEKELNLLFQEKEAKIDSNFLDRIKSVIEKKGTLSYYKIHKYLKNL